MGLKQAVQLIEQGLDLGTKGGLYNLNGATMLNAALNEIKKLVPEEIVEETQVTEESE